MTVGKVRWLVLALMVTACGSVEPTPSAEVEDSLGPSPATPTAEATTTAEPSPTVEPTASPMRSRADSTWTVLVTDLVVRSAPGVGSDSRILPETLAAGDWVYVVDGPLAMDGYEWFLVQNSRVHPGAAFGWIAAGSREGERWIEERTVECPPEPTDESQAIALTLDQRLICFSREALTITLSLPEPGCSVAGGMIQSIDPQWLSAIGTYGTTGGFLGVAIEFGVAWHPDVGTKCAQPAGHYSVVGQFDDAAARTCEYRGDPPVPHPQQVILHCRAQFVVTQVLSEP